MVQVKYIPDGCSSVSAYLIVKNGRKTMDFYTEAFGATASECLNGPDGAVLHGEVRIGNSTVMISEENPAWNLKSAETMGGSPVSLHIYVEDVDKAFQRAVAAGCKEIAPVTDMFWGDRYGKVADPFGFQWGIATHVEDVSEPEMQRRCQEWMQRMAQGQEACATTS